MSRPYSTSTRSETVTWWTMAGKTESVRDLEERYKGLQERLASLKADKSTVEAELAARQRALKKSMDECRDAGFDPDNLQEEIRRAREVASVKLDTFEADIEAGEKIVRPLVEEIRKG